MKSSYSKHNDDITKKNSRHANALYDDVFNRFILCGLIVSLANRHPNLFSYCTGCQCSCFTLPLFAFFHENSNQLQPIIPPTKATENILERPITHNSCKVANM
jgi:hypothetical protein